MHTLHSMRYACPMHSQQVAGINMILCLVLQFYLDDTVDLRCVCVDSYKATSYVFIIKVSNGGGGDVEHGDIVK